MQQCVDEVAEIRARVLPHFGGWDGAAVARISSGLINRSYLLTRGDGARAVLQAVNAIFPPEMHGNIVGGDRAAGGGGPGDAAPAADQRRARPTWPRRAAASGGC